MTAAEIRAICEREFKLAPSDPVFELERRESETEAQMLVRLFDEEKDAQIRDGRFTTDERVVLVLCHG